MKAIPEERGISFWKGVRVRLDVLCTVRKVKCTVSQRPALANTLGLPKYEDAETEQ